MRDLNNQRILVTGASKGIGKAIAALLLQKGAIVALNYRNTLAGVEELQKNYGAERAIPIHADLENQDETIDLFKSTLEKLSGLDTIILNAGIFEPHPVDDSLSSWLEVWKKTMQVNLDSVGILTRLCVEYFKKQKQGRLVYIGSRAAFRGETQEYLAYAASKGGITSLAKSVARSFGKYNIKAFVVAPGFTKTEMAMEAISKIGPDKVLENLALNRLTTPEDIAPLVALMCSGLMDHATGVTIDVNAGSYIR